MKSILILDAFPIIRQGIAALFIERNDWFVFGSAGSLRHAEQLIDEAHPDLILLGLNLPDASGTHAITHLSMKAPHSRIVASSPRSQDRYAQQCLVAGAHGYVSKTSLPDEFIKTIDEVANEQVGDFVDQNELPSSNVIGQCIESAPLPHPDRPWEHYQSDQDAPLRPLDALSDRELLVLELIGSGQSTAEISRYIGIKPKTVDSYRERIKKKLSLESTSALTHYAIRWVIGLESI